MNGSFKLPSSEQMMEDWEEEKRDRAARGYTKRQAHMMGPDQVIYNLLSSNIRNNLLSELISNAYIEAFEGKDVKVS